MISRSPFHTEKIAQQIAKKYKRKTYCLWGELGSGKTTFVKGLGKFLGVKRKIVKSPTFLFLHEYHGTRGKLYHFDFYRITRRRSDIMKVLHEVLHKKDGFIAIEWPDRLKKFLPRRRADVFFTHYAPKARKIILSLHR